MNNEKAKKKLNFFDFLIGAVIVIILAIITYVLILSPMKEAKIEHNIEFVVEVPTSTLDVLEIVNIGDKVTLSGKSEATIKDVTFSPAQKLSLDQTTGEYKLSIVPEKYDIRATVTAPASETNKDISVGNMPVKIGTKMALEGRGYSINGSVIDMTLFDKNGEEIKQ